MFRASAIADKAMTPQIVVRRMWESDVGAADRVLRAAFARQTSFVEHVRLTLALEPEGVLVAEEAGQIVGTVGAVDYGPLAYVGLMRTGPLTGRTTWRTSAWWLRGRRGRWPW
jgi:predicted N-acetyltransferase YhbS